MAACRIFACLLLLGLSCSVADGLGVNWGTIATHRLPPKTVAQLLQDNGIKKAKIFDAEETSMKALAGTGIEVMIAIPNDMLAMMNDYDAAKEWVKKNVTRYNFDKGNALNEAGVGDTIKATIPLNADVYDSPRSNPVPSAGKFRSDIGDLMTQIVEFFSQHGAPFIVNIYPFLSLYGHSDFPIDYAFFDGTSNPVLDKGVEYTNVFDANFDTLVSALKKVGFGDLPIVVGEVGWPTDGDVNANVTMAERFYAGLLKRLAAGTPLRPNATIEVYLFGLIDEDAKSVAPGNFERHWGLFTYDGQPKFPVDLSGKGQNKLLVGAKDVEYLPRKWCAVNPSATDLSKLADNVKYACAHADCTSLGDGCSCSGLDARSNASYAFNVYFQTQNQKDESCDFQGLAAVTTQNMSHGTCNFTIQIVPSASSFRRPQLGVLLSAIAGLLSWIYF
ncbi:hypothetical protein B296_00030733 [Ensete ventricosum]|uniref:X8 domain-containing protein n=1 Tax=Ensete ventricosum TaxID=4639 RepID=A0A426ZLK1_ENSVE|nr:hypothetical protein B296_00030733 [Ensete ventricosum]